MATRGRDRRERTPSPLGLGERLTGCGSSPREKGEREGSYSWEFEENTPFLYCVVENKDMAPTRRNGVPFLRTGPDSGDRRAGKRAHSTPGRDATSGSDHFGTRRETDGSEDSSSADISGVGTGMAAPRGTAGYFAFSSRSFSYCSSPTAAPK